MRRGILVGFVLFLLGCRLTAATPVGVPASGTYRNVVDSVAVLATEGMSLHCSGVFVDDVIVTAAHCIRPDMSVASWDGFFRNPQQFWSADCIHHDAVQDIAILSVNPAASMRHGEVVLGEEPLQGDSVAAIGHPAGNAFSLTVGVVSFPRRNYNHAIWTQSDSPIYYGNSGGALVNQEGYLVGVASFMHSVPHLGFWVHRDAIEDALASPKGCK